MVSSPWIVDSAPELRFTTPSAVDAVVGAAGGRVVHRLAGRVVAEEPRSGDAGDVAEAGPVACLGRRQQRLDAGVGAVGDLDAFGRRRQPPVLRPGRDEQVRGERGGVRQSRAEHGPVAGDLVRLSQPGRRQTAPRVPHRLGPRPREHGTERPGARVAGPHRGDALTELSHHVPSASVAGRRHIGGQSEQRLTGRVGAIDDEPRRHGHPVDVEPVAVANQHLTLDGVEGEVETITQERGELRVARGEGRVGLTERPDRPGQPVRVVAVGRIGKLDRLGARVERAVRLHPQHHVARIRPVDGLHEGQPPQQLVGRPPARLRAGRLPVPHVDHRRARDVIGVEGALSPRVSDRVVDAAPDPSIASVGLPIGVRPQHTDGGLLGQSVGGSDRPGLEERPRRRASRCGRGWSAGSGPFGRGWRSNRSVVPPARTTRSIRRWRQRRSGEVMTCGSSDLLFL